MVAIFVLLIGALGSVVMIDAANGLTSNNKSREGALSLSREIAEAARQTDYDTLTPSGVESALQNSSSALQDADTTATGWQLIRRGIRYNVTVAACVYDDGKDGTRSQNDTGTQYCASSGAATDASKPSCTVRNPAPPCIDSQPDDFRQLTISSSWTVGSTAKSATQTALIVNPSGGRGPRITNVTTSPALVGNTFTDSTAGTTYTFNITTNSLAGSLEWGANPNSNGNSSGQGTTPPGDGFNWQVVWDLGTAGTAGAVLDGNYTIGLQAFSLQGVAGDFNVQSLVVNRSIPSNVTGFQGGRDNRNGEIVDLQWTRNKETDIVGYRVYRVNDSPDWQTPVGGGNAADTLVCGVSAPLDASSCIDQSPPSPGTAATYYVKAVDKSPSNVLRESPGSAGSQINVAANATAAPTFPAGTTVSATVSGGVPVVTWTNAATAASGHNILFYRIYRDPGSANPTYAERYDTNGGPDTNLTYKDQNPGAATAHTYYVTAVDDTFQESQPITPPAVSP